MSDHDKLSTRLTGNSFWALDRLVSDLHKARERWRVKQHRNRDFGGREFPSINVLQQVVKALNGALFPMRLGPEDLHHESEDAYVFLTLGAALNALLQQVTLELEYTSRNNEVSHQKIHQQATTIVSEFADQLASIREILDTDVEAAYKGDPAARSVDEVLLCYPGILTIINHRLAHLLYKLGAPLVARIISEIAHSETGIDIHPGATIGNSFFIDHGTGVVIGETAEIGDRVRIYQAVTLGAKSFPVDEQSGELKKGLPRHPIVEDDVVIYAGATILGRVTIGHHSTVGGNVWLTHGVPPYSHVVQATSKHETPLTTEPSHTHK